MQTYLPLDARLEDVIAALSPDLRNEHWEAPPDFTWERVFALAVPEPPASRDVGEFAYRDRSWVDVKIHSAPGGIVLLAAGYLLAHSNASGILVAVKDATGTVIRAFNLPTPATVKMDCLDGDHQGTAYAFAIGGHEPISTEQRLNVVYVAVLTEVLPAYPGGQAPFGAAVDARTYGGTEPMPSEPIDYARIGVLVQSQIDQLASLFGGTVRGGIQEKVEDALVWLLTVTPEQAGDRWPVAVAFRDAFYAQLNNITGAQNWKTLIEAGLVPPQRAPAWVRALPGYPWGVV